MRCPDDDTLAAVATLPDAERAAIADHAASCDTCRGHPSMAAFVSTLAKRRRWPYVAVGVTALALIGVVVFAPRDDPERACDAILAPSGWTLPRMKPIVAATVERILGRYATEWQTLARSSCIAAARRELSELAYAATTRCLEQRKDTLSWITTQADLGEHELLGLAEALEPIETCRGQGSEVVPTAELVALQRDLARAAPFVQHLPEKATDVDELLARAKQLDDPTSIAEASYLLGLLQHARSLDPTESLKAAIAAAEHVRDDRIRMRASALLAIVLARKGRLSEAITQRDVALSAAARAPNPGSAQNTGDRAGVLRANDAVTTIAVEQANVELAFMRDFDAEIAAFRRIEAIQLARFGELSLSLVDTRFRYAEALLRKRHPDGTRIGDLAFEGLKQLTNVHTEIALQQAARAERNPVARVPIQERIVEILRRQNSPRLQKELEILAYDYEIVGTYERALHAMSEAIAIGSPSAVLLETAAYYAFEIADRSDDNLVRKRRLDEALAFLERLPAIAQELDSVQAIRGRILLRAGRLDEAMPQLTNALAAAEGKEPQEPYHIAIRSFALAQALWQGSKRDRERAIALAEQAARRLPEARDELAAFQNGALLGRLDDQLARIEAWRRTHR